MCLKLIQKTLEQQLELHQVLRVCFLMRLSPGLIPAVAAMISERQVTILNTLGLHVRPAQKFVEVAVKFSSEVSVIKDGKSVNAKYHIDLLTLAAEPGTQLTIRAEGEDSAQAVESLAQLVESRFGEE